MSQTKTQLVEGLNINTSAPADALVLDSSGRVGIGESTPDMSLHVNGGTDNSIALFESTDATAYIAIKDSASTEPFGNRIGAEGNGLFIATNNGTKAITIDSSQQVGIGNTSPVHQLDLNKAGTNWEAGFDATQSGANSNLNIVSTGVSGGRTGEIQFLTGTGAGGTVHARLTSSGNFGFNSGYGSVATAYGCRAWVNFDGTGTVSIRDSGNVSSITDNGTGDYTVNFSTAMPDANFAPVVSGQNQSGGAPYVIGFGTLATSSVSVQRQRATGAMTDGSEFGVAIFR